MEDLQNTKSIQNKIKKTKDISEERNELEPNVQSLQSSSSLSLPPSMTTTTTMSPKVHFKSPKPEIGPKPKKLRFPDDTFGYVSSTSHSPATPRLSAYR